MEAVAVRDLRLRDARDRDIFLSARKAKAIILIKDSDMADLVTQLGSPSNAKLKTILAKAWPVAEHLLKAGEKIVEISDTMG